MKKITSIILIVTLLLSICTCTAYAHDNSSEQPFDENISVLVVGNYNFTTQYNLSDNTLNAPSVTSENNSTFDFSDHVLYTDSLCSSVSTSSTTSFDENISASPTAVVISPNVLTTYLRSGREKAALEAMIDEGHIAFFPETSYEEMTSIFKSIANSAYNALPVGGPSNDHVTAFVFKNEKGDYFTGNIISPASAKQETIDARIIKETADNSFLSTSAAKAGYEDFEPSASWNELSAWHKNVFQGEYTGNEWFSEWICFFSAQGSDGGHYYALAGEWCMEPVEINGIQWVSDYVRYESDASGLQDGVQLRSYWPKNEPGSSSGSVSISADNDKTLSFGITFDWQIDDLSFEDNSSQANDYCKLRWDYSHHLSSHFDEKVSYGNFVMIFKDTEEAGEYTFHHYRTAYSYAENMIGESASKNWRSTYDFEP